jgi:uncharacterized protein (DUF2336 family)
MTHPAQTLLGELDAALPRTTAAWRGDALRKVADLFVSAAPSYSAEQVALFDAVMNRFIPTVAPAQLAELSGRMAPLNNAPAEVVRTLAGHADPSVSMPILAQAPALADAELIRIADDRRTSAELLKIIAARPVLSTDVTDALLNRGNTAIQRAVIDNKDARISEAGFARIIMGLKSDKPFAAAVAARDDLPPELRPWLAKILD